MTIGCQHTIHSSQHNFGWNKDNTPRFHIAPGDTIEFDCIDAGGGEFTPATTSADYPSLDLSRFGPLTGPIYIDGAIPGDALKITILGFDPSGWGWSLISDRYGILRDQITGPFIKIWHYEAGFTPIMYNDLARVPLKPFPGIIGLAPAEPGTHNALQPRRVGGNLDCRDISVGTELYLPVEAPGALLSLGDTHAAQGNGELAGTALESPMKVALKVELLKDEPMPGPRLVTPGPVVRHLDAKGYHVTCGVDEDLLEACRIATSHMIDLLGRLHHLDPTDAYLLCSVCGDLAISEMVNRPVNVVSLYFPRMVVE